MRDENEEIASLFDERVIDKLAEGKTNWHRSLRAVLYDLVVNQAAVRSKNQRWVRGQVELLSKPNYDDKNGWEKSDIDPKLLRWFGANGELLGRLAPIFRISR